MSSQAADPHVPDDSRGDRLSFASSSARESTGFLLAMAAHRFRHHFERAMEPLGIQVRQFGVLTTLRHFGPVPQQRLVNSICIDRSTMVTLIDELETAGLVERLPDPEDRRVHRVRLTDSGRAVHSASHALMLEVEAELLSVLEPGDREELRRLLVIVGDLDRSTGFEHINIRGLARTAP